MAARVLLGLWLALAVLVGGSSVLPVGHALADSDSAAQVQRQQEQPLNNAPVWRAVREGEPGVTQVRGRETGVLIQSSGETWRLIRNGPVTLYGGILLILLPILILGFYKFNGPMQLHGKPTGRSIERFTRWERIVHWSAAITFVILAVTGILLLFGKHFLIPVIGYSAFSWIAAVSIRLHNFVGPLFIFCMACMLVTFFRDNLPRRIDWEWLKKAPQVLTGKAHVPSGKYNAAEKGWFWGGVAFLGLVVGASGLVLNFPNFDQTRLTMQIANIVHGVGALIFILASFGHIYMGTIGTEGAYEGMKTGMVDETWAKEHHQLWYEEVRSSAARPQAGGSAEPAKLPT
ncbi:MAG TPA: formate dehydrogenase subunit gamma [Burkholderiales bacterium]|nr:formate dehydrogenase subunit gamma [Burkholderiales bacterium]